MQTRRKNRSQKQLDLLAVVNLADNSITAYDWFDGRLERPPLDVMRFRRILVFHGLGKPEEESELLRLF